jgi:hypothetical protein
MSTSTSKLEWRDSERRTWSRATVDKDGFHLVAKTKPGSGFEATFYAPWDEPGSGDPVMLVDPELQILAEASLPDCTTLEQAKEAAEQWLRAGVRDGSIDPFRAVREWAGEGEVVCFKWERSEKDPDFLRLCRIGSDGTPSVAAVVWSGGKLHEACFHGELTSCPFGTQACAVDFVEKQAQKRQEWARGAVTCHFDRAALEVT